MDHVRIDDGYKRGKRKPRNAVSKTTGQFLPVLPASEHQAAVANAAARIATGEFLEDIARDIGVTKQALSLWLLDECPAQYSEAKRKGLIRRIVDADHKLESADNPLDLARAREIARFARWDAERRLPGMFGPKQEVTHRSDPQLHVHVNAAQPIEPIDITPLPGQDGGDASNP